MENIDQTNYEQDNHQIKIRTPASLFLRSNNKNPSETLRQHQSPNRSVSNVPACENHPQKIACYYTNIDDQSLHFCEKCAITLASQGHTILKLKPEANKLQSTPKSSNSIRIDNSPSPSLNRNSQLSTSHLKNSQLRGSRAVRGRRESEIENLVSSVRELRSTIGNTRETIKQKLIESQQFYGEQLQEVNDYFTLVMKSLELQKHKCYNHILRERKEAELSIRGINQQLTTVDQDLTRILLDIEDNLDTVYSIQEHMYQLVLSQHQQQQQQFREVVSGLLLTPIEMRKIEFEGVPDSIYHLSDLVIENSVNSQQPQYRLMDSLNAEDLGNIRAISPRQENRDNTPYRQISQTDSLKFSFEAQRLRADRRTFGESIAESQQE